MTGVMGEGDQVGVVGCNGQNGAGLPGPLIAVGVAGVGTPFPQGLNYSYGGWFSRGVDQPQQATAPLHLEPASASDPNPPQQAQRGDLLVDSAGNLWFCTASDNIASGGATLATWKQVVTA
jgi:hypothetical protein